MLWPCNGAIYIYQGFKGNGSVPEKASDSNSYVPGRLADSSQVSGGSDKSCRLRVSSGRVPGDHDKSEEISFDSYSDFRISRGSFRPSSGAGLSFGISHSEDSGLDSSSQSKGQHHCKGFSVSLGPSQLCSRFCAPRPSAPQTPTVLSEVFLRPSSGPSRNYDSTPSTILRAPSMVELSRESEGWGAIASSRGSADSYHRCQPEGLGRSSGETADRRFVVRRRPKATYQYVGDEGSSVVSEGFSPISSRQMCENSLGQHDRGVLHSASRRDPLSQPLCPDKRAVQFLSDAQDFSQSSLHPRQEECIGRQLESAESNQSVRMDSVKSFVSSDLRPDSDDSVRSVCHVQKQSAPSVCEPVSGRSGLGSRCHVIELGKSNSLCIPSKGSDSRNPSQGPRHGLYINSDSSSLVNSTMVPNTSRTVGGISPCSSPTQENAESARLSPIPHQSQIARSSRVDHIENVLVQRGFSQKIAARAARPQRKSSLSIYESHFQAFLDWLSQESASLESVTIQVVAEYFNYMFETLKRQPTTIANHRSALSSCLPLFDGFSVGTHPVITDLMKNFQVERPFVRRYAPEWDLLVVLRKLMGPPFEPPSFVSMQDRIYVTWKTVFLLALACTKRASEIHAISRDKKDLIFTKEGVYLRAVPGFLAKNQAAGTDFKPFFVPRHDSFSGRDTPDRFLCPVRMLKFYLNFTKDSASSRLFVKCKGEGSVCTKTISSWLKNCIIFCNKDSGNSNINARPHGHDVRKFSASWAQAAGFSVSEILCAGSWASQSTFTSHYLMDVQRQTSEVFRLHPVIAGKRIS